MNLQESYEKLRLSFFVSKIRPMVTMC